MDFISIKNHKPCLLLHGGAGPMDPTAEGMKKASLALKKAAQESLKSGAHDLALVVRSLEHLEDDPQFNAGFGSALQADGKPRLTAAVMDGRRQCFSGVISISDVRHPSRLAWALQDHSTRVLTGPGHELLARRLNQPVENLITEKRFAAWQKKLHDEFFVSDTVGAVIADNGRLSAGTSTGGRGYEDPGRVSDSATVAGNYASRFAAISATGIGEEIVDDALAARLETRVRDGMSLEAAARKCYDEALAAKRCYGWIACDALGNISIAYTSDAMSYLAITLDGEVLASS
ncbi:MAG TPA: isoaspartyl peptidase/L-asparaginase [Oligoflexus sp.]|uniref:isoaspartyl peptidase/L-asparaginase n=1 Tax=Oligoflexus sp. TaxID=1971216 RepID=UPI002D7FF5FC|nr:isoaspartyl peptidase/L-asparaginase [Oligoflexus sp.]HET9238925.1 isoaspartyl peptidase/L-asparaginase [Oligoflexus sp.]